MSARSFVHSVTHMYSPGRFEPFRRRAAPDEDEAWRQKYAARHPGLLRSNLSPSRRMNGSSRRSLRFLARNLNVRRIIFHRLYLLSFRACLPQAGSE